MGYKITAKASDVIASKNLNPILVLKVDDYPIFMTSTSLMEIARYGGEGLFYGMPGLVYGGTVAKQNQEDLINLGASTQNITQQISQTDAAGSSTTNVTIGLVNKDNVFSDLVTPVGTSDLISKKATVYLGAEGMSFPEDFIVIFVGSVTAVNLAAGIVKITVSHPEDSKRAEIFTKIQTDTSAALTSLATTIPVLSTAGFLLPKDLLETYVRIDDEIIRYTGVTATSLTGCTRGRFDTLPAIHDVETSVDSFYVLGDATSSSNAITMALKVMISGSSDWVVDREVSTLGVSTDPLTQNSIFFPDQQLVAVDNVQVGDFVTLSGSTIPSNNIASAVILAVVDEFEGSRIVISQPLTPEVEAISFATIRSQYDTLPDGVGLTPDQVDIAEFLNIQALFGSSIPNYRIYLKDSVTGKALLNEEILFPAACYSIPRKGKVSLGKTKPPIASFDTQTLDETTVLNAKGLQIDRSSLENFYNAVIYRFEEDAIEDKFLAGRITLSATSTNRIKVGNKPFQITSKGLRRTADNEIIIQNNAVRLLDRFQFGAESISGIKVSFSTGWATEVGDTVIVQGLQLFDSKTGERTLSPRIMEVTNRSFNFKQGIITLDVTDTAFALDGRYGTLSPSSVVGEFSTSTEVLLVKSFGTAELEKEKDKWSDYVGEEVLVHSPDWTEFGQATFLGFSPSNDNQMLLSTGLAFTPDPGYIVDIAKYDEAGAKLKTLHCFFDPHAKVIAGSPLSQTQFRTDSPSIFFEGCTIVVHDAKWTNRSNEVTVASIVGSLITTNAALGYVPAVGDEVDLIGFVSDEGLPYRIL